MHVGEEQLQPRHSRRSVVAPPSGTPPSASVAPPALLWLEYVVGHAFAPLFSTQRFRPAGALRAQTWPTPHPPPNVGAAAGVHVRPCVIAGMFCGTTVDEQPDAGATGPVVLP